MLRLVTPSGATHVLEREGLENVLDVAAEVKRSLQIPRGEQRYLLGGAVLSMLSDLPRGDVILTLVRVCVVCRCCGAQRRGRKLRACGGCLEEHYCDEICQMADWRRHRVECSRADGREPPIIV